AGCGTRAGHRVPALRGQVREGDEILRRVRKGHVMNPRLYWAAALAAFAVPASAQIDGTVINATTEKPQAGGTINLVHPGENGMQTMATATSDAKGMFKINQAVPPPPALLQATFQDAQYTLVLQPGAPSSGVRVNVYNSTNQISAANLQQQHLL